MDDLWYHNDVVLVWEVQYCSGFAPRGPTTELSYRKRRKQWAIIRIRWLCARSVLETVGKPSNVPWSEHKTVATEMLCSID